MAQHDRPAEKSSPRRPSRRPRRAIGRRSSMAVVVAVVAALTVGIGAQPASASIGSTYSSHTLTMTVTGAANFGVICQGGNVAVTSGDPIAVAPCSDVQHITINGDGANQIVGLRGVTDAAFPALISNTVILGAGTDVFFTSPQPDIVNMGADGDSVDVDLDGAGDLINAGGDPTDGAVFLDTGGANHLTLTIAGANPTVTSDGGKSESVIGVAFVYVDAAAGNDSIDATGVPGATAVGVTLLGGTGNDTINDGPEPASIDGGAGDDTINGGGGNDGLIGSAGNDHVDGGAGGDHFLDPTPLIDRVFGGDTYTDPDPSGTTWSAEFSRNDAALRIRPAAGAGWSVTSGLTRPGAQALPSTITSLAAITHAQAGTNLHRSVVDTVLVPGKEQDISSSPGDLVDVTVSSGTWTTAPNGLGGTYVSNPGATASVDGGASTHVLVHGPWADAPVSFAHRSYRDLLFRFPSAANRDYLAGRLRSGATTRAAVASTITTSDEYRGIEVDRVFTQFLRRASDPSGRAYWVGKLGVPISMRAFRANLLGSGEYYRNFASSTASGFVTALYADLLNRTPDSGGLSYWVGRLNSGVSRGSVANSFLSSSEGRTEIVTTQFLRLANRPPTSAEISTWSDQLLNATTGETDLVAFLLASSAYYSRIN